MRNYYSTLLFRALIMLVAISILPTSTHAQEQRSDYIFRHNRTPLELKPYATTIFASSPSDVTTMRGDVLLELGKKDKIADFEISPAGNLYVVISANKKGEKKANVYSTMEAAQRKFKFDVKHYGIPTAAAFTSDARMIVIATDKGIFLFDARKFQPLEKIDLVPIEAEDIIFSPNGYYMVLVNGKDAVVYNFETKKIRTRIDAEVKINDIVFSPDSQMMALLTDDGLLSIYDTRTFEVRTMLDDLGEGIACDFNDNGKYIAVATSPDHIEVINLLRTSSRNEYDLLSDGMTDLIFFLDSSGNPLLGYSSSFAVNARRMLDLEPYYSRLVSDTVDEQMAEWLKMQPGESLVDYQNRVNEESRMRQRRLFEDNISTQLAGDMLSMSSISLGNYDRTNGLLAVEFTNLPSIMLPVAETDLGAFTSGSDLEISDAQYGLLPDDSFELIYARFFNKNDNKTYIYDNIERRPMDMLGSDTDFVDLDILRQQQMEEIKLQEVKEKVIEEAKQNNIISDHTNIAVDSKVQPDYDADGNKILNYVVKFTYQVEPAFSAVEDFAPGKYHVSQSGAASSMLKIVKDALEGDLSQYVKDGKRLKVRLSGTADATPIVHGIPYDGAYGDFDEEPVTIDGNLTTLSITPKEGIKTNEQLALLRAAGVKDFLQKNVKGLSDMNAVYDYNVGVSKDKGSEFRRITAEFIFVDAF